ncbi:MAG: S-methyl-5-thioribose-1-phosphate isomerase [Planctomycetota bacterium]
MHPPFETVAWVGALPGRLRLLDQTRLPEVEVYETYDDVAAIQDAIRRLVVRGAPAIGVAAAYGLVVGAQTALGSDGAGLTETLERTAAELDAARPTAVNLRWALERMLAHDARVRETADVAARVERLLAEAERIAKEDREQCLAMGEHGARFLRDKRRVLTHCNAGALATAGIGTALAPIYVATSQGVELAVFANETRPLLQGARLTSWELARAGVDVTLITDGMGASLMRAGRVDAVIVGSDRIARNGDVCNKIGTYAVALAARAHGLPFYVVAPRSTFDARAATGADIPIELRDRAEIVAGMGRVIAPEGIGVHNPAFDVTPAEFVTAIVTEAGVIEAPNEDEVVRHLALEW